MSTDVANDQEILDADVTVVDDVAVAEEAEKRDAELLARVEKIMDGSVKPADKTKHSGGVDDSSAEGVVEKPVELIQALRDRAGEAGIPEDLAQRLHQSGLLEESLAAFDRQSIERARGSKQDLKEPPKKKEEPKGSDRGGEGDELPALDPELFDEALVKRDETYRKQLSELRAQVAQLSQRSDVTTQQRDGKFQQWFAENVKGLGNAKLFGDGEIAKDSSEHKNRQSLCDGYERICEARGVDPYDCHVELLKRAYPALFPTEVFKDAQRETVQRLRDAEGKFIQPTRSSGSPPSKKRETQEERDEALVKKVEGIMKRS